MKLIYRIQNHEGHGPYHATGTSVNNLVHNKFSQYKRHPSPSRDAGLSQAWDKIRDKPNYYYRNWLFGYTSMEQLKAWFYTHEIRNALHRDGFHITVYRVHDRKFYAGDTQAIYRPDGTERIVETISFETLI